MKSMFLVVTMLLFLVLTGCNNTPQTVKTPDMIPSSGSNEDFSDTESLPAEENEVETMPELTQETEPSETTGQDDEAKTEIPVQATDTTASEKTNHSETISPFQIVEAKPSETEKNPEHSEPSERPNQEQTQSESNEPVSEDTQKPTTAKEKLPEEEPSKPDFDIDYWISFAKNYAVTIGLELSPAAIECWDNPMIAGTHSKYLERDIIDCLNCYKNVEGFTGVWIWAEPDGNGAYKLYIGYE